MSSSFAQLGLPDALVSALARRDITEPFPVQAATIPDALAGRDVSGKAPTGSGKTLAFGLPMLARIEKGQPRKPRGLILAPTRELAEQIKQELAPLAKKVGRYVFAVYGGVSYGPQKQALRRGVDILVATPGRLEDLIEQRSIDLRGVDLVVVDEADRMADMGFMPSVRRLLDQTSKKRQTLLFSATLDGDIAVLSRNYQNDPVRHEAESIEPDVADAEHHFWLVDHHDRVEHTANVVDATGRSIVFTRTRHGADRLAKQLSRFGVGAVAMHGGRSQAQRTRALKEFSSGRAQALIATDVAARGIHVDAVESVVHFDPPSGSKDYLHRSGRTARAGAGGTVVSLVTGGQKRGAQRMQRELDLDVRIEAPRMADIRPGQKPKTNSPRRPELGNRNLPKPQPRKQSSNDRSSDSGNDRSRDDRNGRSRSDGNGRSRDDNNGRSRSGSNGRSRDDRNARSAPQTERHEPAKNGKSNGVVSIYVANLSWEATTKDMAQLFGRFGDVRDTTIIEDKWSGKSKGFGFVDMPREHAERAIKELNGAMLRGRDLEVREALPRRYGT